MYPPKFWAKLKLSSTFAVPQGVVLVVRDISTLGWLGAVDSLLGSIARSNALAPIFIVSHAALVRISTGQESIRYHFNIGGSSSFCGWPYPVARAGLSNVTAIFLTALHARFEDVDLTGRAGCDSGHGERGGSQEDDLGERRELHIAGQVGD